MFCADNFVRYILSGLFCPVTFCPVYFVRYVLSGYILSGIFCPGIYIYPGVFCLGIFILVYIVRSRCPTASVPPPVAMTGFSYAKLSSRIAPILGVIYELGRNCGRGGALAP